MNDPNKIIQNITALKKRIDKDISQAITKYELLTNEMDIRFREELSYHNGSVKGLEDFFSLILTLKKNNSQIKNAGMILKRMKDISNFNVSEEVDSKKELENILS